MQLGRKRFLIKFACCITMIEATYQLIVYFHLPLTFNIYCEHVGATIQDGVAHYQFRHFGICNSLNKTIADIIDPTALSKADAHLAEMISLIAKAPPKSSVDTNIIWTFEVFWFFLNILHIASSCVLFMESVIATSYFKYTTVPWIVLTFIVFIFDVLSMTAFIGIYVSCIKPSTCVLLSGLLQYSQLKELKHLDQYSFAGSGSSQLYDTIAYMPFRYVLVACKHVFGVPVLVILACVFIRDYASMRHPKLPRVNRVVDEQGYVTLR